MIDPDFAQWHLLSQSQPGKASLPKQKRANQQFLYNIGDPKAASLVSSD